MQKKETLFFKAHFIYIFYNFCDFFFFNIEFLKNKGVIEDLNLKKVKNDRKNISRNFSDVAVGSVGSVHFRIVP